MTTMAEHDADLAEFERAFFAAGADWKEEIDADVMQRLSVFWYSQDRDSPAMRWWKARAFHPAIYRFLRVDPADPYAPYACAPFRVWQDPDTGKARILAAYPAPRLIDALDEHDVIEQVIAWAPQANVATMLGDAAPQLAGAFTDRDAGTLFADPFAFFRAWVEARAAWAVEYLAAKGQAWRTTPMERDLVPGCLMLGKVDDIAWAPSAMPETLNCIGVDPRAVNRAVLKAARLPMAVNSRPPLRRAA